ncbi:MAG TPA: isoprenylcysteine carboxylmethyltransferase family protein [Smithella sp.]|nr:isoprenylcysteine carboxylmethyltransferase family protein [Smithella sp.]HPK21801.1 isoprenylcysteine carboxylmethyltransferase family protein [Smithella sp.]HQN70395.1 isoprenylcysteine carboxylmethyltransferase family protein [Smithella sp.]
MIEKLRIIVSRIFVVLLFVLLCFSSSQWEEEAYFVTAVLFFIGVILVAIASLGRLWCSVYIAGYKTDHLITQGPYSMCRNPLYFFSILGALGIGFASETLLIPLLIFIAFVIYYPSVIRSEEAGMMKLHKNEFAMYMQKVPRFFPKLSLLNEPEEYIVRPKVLKRHIFDALWFIWIVGILEVIEALHELHIIPILFKIY